VQCPAQFFSHRFRVLGEVADDVGEVEVVCVDEAADAKEDAVEVEERHVRIWRALGVEFRGQGETEGLPDAGEREAEWVLSCCLAELLHAGHSSC